MGKRNLIADTSVQDIVKAIFYFFGKFPHTLFCLIWGVATIPLQIRKYFIYRGAPKHIVLRLVSEEPVTANEAQELIHILHDTEMAHERAQKGRGPTLKEMFVALANEYKSSLWKFPSTKELALIKDELERDMRARPRGAGVWAIDDGWHMFVAIDPFTGAKAFVRPKRVVSSVLRGKPPDSEEKHYAYAVSVTLQEKNIE